MYLYNLRVSLLIPFIIFLSSYLFLSFSTNEGDFTDNKEQEHYDVIIKNGRVLDGTGNPWIYNDIAINGDRIVEVGDLVSATADRVIDADGLYVAPGFIDTHSHADKGLMDMELSHAKPLISQGITSTIINPDGLGPVDLNNQQKELLKYGLGLNVAQFIGHSAVREYVMGMEDRVPKPHELIEMRKLVVNGMEAGAFGLSSGLFSAPGSYADTKEVIDLAKIVSRFDGVYSSHIRDESDYSIGLVSAINEAIEITKNAQLTGIITHIKALGPNVWGLSDSVVTKIETARSNGVAIFADQYPYVASATSLQAALLPQWALAGGREEFLKRLEIKEKREQIKVEIKENLKRRGGAERIQFRKVAFDETLEGKTLRNYADSMNIGPIEATLELLIAGSPDIVSHNMSKNDVERFMQKPWTMTVTDGDLVKMGEGVPHPRSYGTFPRKLSKFARDEGVISIPFAIRSMTYLVAQTFGFIDRGIIREGAIADLVVFDLEKIEDHAEYLAPHQLSTGVVHVIVNGKPVILNMKFTESLPGRIIKKNK